MTESIPKIVRRDHRDALKSRIKYGNQISLRKRLYELTNNLSKQVRINIFGGDGAVPRSWIDTRNYYTHWDDELLPSVLDSQSIYGANIRMHHFIRALYAQLVGISPADTERAFAGVSKCAQELIRLNISEKRKLDPSYTPRAFLTISHVSGNSTDGEKQSADESNLQEERNGA